MKRLLTGRSPRVAEHSAVDAGKDKLVIGHVIWYAQKVRGGKSRSVRGHDSVSSRDGRAPQVNGGTNGFSVYLSPF